MQYIRFFKNSNIEYESIQCKRKENFQKEWKDQYTDQ